MWLAFGIALASLVGAVPDPRVSWTFNNAPCQTNNFPAVGASVFINATTAPICDSFIGAESKAFSSKGTIGTGFSFLDARNASEFSFSIEIWARVYYAQTLSLLSLKNPVTGAQFLLYVADGTVYANFYYNTPQTPLGIAFDQIAYPYSSASDVHVVFTLYIIPKRSSGGLWGSLSVGLREDPIITQRLEVSSGFIDNPKQWLISGAGVLAVAGLGQTAGISYSSANMTLYKLAFYENPLSDANISVLHGNDSFLTPPTAPSLYPTSNSPSNQPTIAPSPSPSISPSLPFISGAPEDTDVSSWAALRGVKPFLLYPFTQRECAGGAYYSRGGLKLTSPENLATCATKPGYLGASRAGVDLRPPTYHQAQLQSGQIGAVSNLMPNMTSGVFNFTLEAWYETKGQVSPSTYNLAGLFTDSFRARFAQTVYSRNFNAIFGPSYSFSSAGCVSGGAGSMQSFFNGEPGLYLITLDVTLQYVDYPFTDAPDVKVYRFLLKASATLNGVRQFCQDDFSLAIYPNEVPPVVTTTDIFMVGNYRSGFGGEGGFNGTCRLIAMHNISLSEDQIEQIYQAGPPNSIPIVQSNATLTVYEDFVSLLNLSAVGYYDHDGDEVKFIRITSLPVQGNVTFINGTGFQLPLTLPFGENLAFTPPESGFFGPIEGLVVAFSDDGVRFSPEPAPVWVFVEEVNDPPEPLPAGPFDVLLFQGVPLSLDFLDYDDLRLDVFGVARAQGAMRNGTRLRPGARIRFQQTQSTLGYLQDRSCTANITAEEDVQYSTGPDAFSFCFRGLGVGVVNFTYAFTDPANLTGSVGSLVVNVLPSLLACPPVARTRPAHLPPCLGFDSFVYLEGFDANLPQAPVSYRILSLPQHGALRLNGPYPSPLSVGQLFSSSLVPNVLFAAESGFFSAVGESPNYQFLDLLGNPLPSPDSFVFRVERAGLPNSINYTYVLHVPVSYLPVSVTTRLVEIEKGSIAFNLSSPTEDVLYVGVMVRASVGRLRFTSPYPLYAGVNLVDEGCSWSGMSAWGCSELRFVTYPSRANEILQTLEFRPPTGGVRNGSQELEVRVYKSNEFDGFSAIGDNLLGEASVALVGDRAGTNAAQILQLTAVIFLAIALAILTFSLCFMYVGVQVFCRII